MKTEPWRRTPEGEVEVEATDGSWVRMPPGSLPAWADHPGEVPAIRHNDQVDAVAYSFGDDR